MIYSIVVPTFNRAEQVKHCVAHIADLDTPVQDFEILVVDDGSTQLVSDFIAESDEPRVRVVRQKNKGPSSARNTGALHAKGRYIVFIDDDCAPKPTWLNTFSTAIKSLETDVMGGSVTNGLSNSLFAECTQLLTDERFRRYKTNTAGVNFLTTSNLLISRDLYGDIGGFDENYRRPGYEDFEFCRRLTRAGHKIGYVPGAVVVHEHSMNIYGFCQQHFNYGRGAFLFYNANANDSDALERRDDSRMNFFLQIFKRCFKRSYGFSALPLLTLILLSQSVSAAGYFYERTRKRQFN